MRFYPALFALGLLGCGPVVATPSAGETGSTDGAEPTTGGGPGPGTSSTSTGTPTPTTFPPTSTTPTTTSATDSSGDDVITGDTCLDFICPPDFVSPIECSVWEQDCLPGDKCMPYANDGGNAWNATRCSPIVDDPAGTGEPCFVEGSGVSGIDTCDGSSMCFNVDPDTLEGTCYAFCEGDEGNPTCAEECATCTVSGDGVLTLCLPTCDPVAQNCDEPGGCYSYSDSFGCIPDGSGDGGAAGEECEAINGCDPGLACIPTEFFAGCEGEFCCSPHCLVGDDTPCGVLPGTECLPWFEDPPQVGCVPANVGVCGIPS